MVGWIGGGVVMVDWWCGVKGCIGGGVVMVDWWWCGRVDWWWCGYGGLVVVW